MWGDAEKPSGLLKAEHRWMLPTAAPAKRPSAAIVTLPWRQRLPSRVRRNPGQIVHGGTRFQPERRATAVPPQPWAPPLAAPIHAASETQGLQPPASHSPQQRSCFLAPAAASPCPSPFQLHLCAGGSFLRRGRRRRSAGLSCHGKQTLSGSSHLSPSPRLQQRQFLKFQKIWTKN